MIPGVDPEIIKQAVDTAQTLNAMTTLQMSHGTTAVRYPADISQLKMLCAVLLHKYVGALRVIALINEESVEELWERLCLAETKHHHFLTKDF